MKDGKEHVAEVHEPRLGGDFLVSTTPLLDEKGRTLGSVLVARNITERKKAEAALRKSEEEFSSLFANMIDGFAYCQMIFDDTGKPVDFVYLQINDAFEKITGLKRDVVVGKKVTEAIPGIKEANPELFEIYGRVASTGKREKFEVFFKPLSMWLSISVYCPRKGYFAATFEDITNRKQQEREIESLSKFPSENPNPIFRLDGNGAILYANAAGASLLTAWKNKVGERAPKNIIQVVADALISDERVELEETFGAKTFSFLFAPITSKGYVNIYATDTTERKKAEEAIKRQAELINLSPDAIIVRTLDGNISFWSTGAEKLYGWTKDEAIGQDINSLLKSEFPQPLEKILRKVKLSGKWSGEITHICKDGSKMFVQSFWLAKFGADGKITEMLESNVDITERIRIQTKLEESAVLLEEYANQMEELANKRAAQLKDAERLAAIGATAGMVGHDIRNPLQAITGDVYLAKTELASTFESEEKKNALESLTEIEKNVDYINKIVADLQDFARPLNPHAEETNLKLVINELLKKNGLPKNVKVNVKVEPEAGKIMADSSYINRIMYNLVTNAVQAMPKGGKLTIQAYKQENDSIITVADTGVGIPESIKGKLFTPMFTTKSKGQGFGLAVIKRMTEALGGTVTFESKVGKGTTFTIRLPSPKI
jgi:PAS domain S-box-containing protein